MGRGSTKVLIRKITTELAAGPKTIAELAESCDLDRAAVSSYVGILKDSGLLLEELEGTSKRFTLLPTYRTDTYFGLPLTPEAERNVQSLYHRIRQYWSQETKRKLLSTHVQKIVFEVASKFENLKIPYGWYLYGGISVASYDNSVEYPHHTLSPEVEKYAEETTKKYAKNEFAWQSKQLQYSQQNNQLYKVKEEILAILYSPDFDVHPKRSLYVMTKKLLRLLKLVPESQRKDFSETLNSYYDLVLDLYSRVDEKSLANNKRDITVLFENIWKYIALFNFKKDLEKFYSREVLEIHFELDFLQQEDEITELASQLQLLVPEEIDEGKKELHEALDKIKLLKDKDKEGQRELIKKKKKELGEEKFKEWLFNQVGL